MSNIKMKTIAANINDLDGIKRFYFDCEIETKCPKCKTDTRRDFNEDYIEYPEIGKLDTLSFCCDNCQRDWEIKYKIEKIEIQLSFEEGVIND